MRTIGARGRGTTARSPVRPRTWAVRWVLLALSLIGVLLGAQGGFALPASGTGGAAVPGGVAAMFGRAVVTSDTPILTLVPSPSVGNAPLHVNVSASVVQGTPPYSLSLCFGTTDHTSPPPACGNLVHAWSGSSPLVFGHLYGVPGNYSVLGIATDARGAGVGSTALIVVTNGSSLVATAFESASTGPAPLSVSFRATISGGTPPTTIQWTFGDGASGSGIAGVAVAHSYDHAGTFLPTLTVLDGAGHVVTQHLPAVSVSARPTTSFGLGGGAGGGSVLWPAFAVFLVATAGIFVVVRWVRRRRWKREGNDLVRGLGEGANAPGPLSPPP